MDDFVKRLYDLYLVVKKEGIAQVQNKGNELFRSFFFHQKKSRWTKEVDDGAIEEGILGILSTFSLPFFSSG